MDGVEMFYFIILRVICIRESKKLVENSQSLQLKLAVSALRTLKKGGTFVYSTCTLNKKENEEILKNLAEYFSIEDTDVHPLLNRLTNIQIEKLILKTDEA